MRKNQGIAGLDEPAAVQGVAGACGPPPEAAPPFSRISAAPLVVKIRAHARLDKHHAQIGMKL